MFPEWHHAVPESAYFKVPETLKTFRMYSTSRYAPCATRLNRMAPMEYLVIPLLLQSFKHDAVLNAESEVGASTMLVSFFESCAV